jgi:hypothetical protein
MIRVNGIMEHEEQRQYRKELLNDINEGLFIIDDRIADVTVTHINDLGLE